MTANIVIDGNIIDYGISTPDQIAIAQYGYDSCFVLSGDATVTNNYFGGILVGNSLVSITNGASLFTNNKFDRNNLVIPSYIAVTSSSDQIIKDNIFDTFTVDGVNNDVLVTGLTVNSTYTENKNQTGYATITKTDHVNYNSAMVQSLTALDSITYKPHYTYGYNQPSGLEELSIYYYENVTATVTILSNFQLNDQLPENVQILNMVIGLQCTVTGHLDGGYYSLISQTSNAANFNPSSLSGSLADVKSQLAGSAGLNADELIAELNVVYSGGITLVQFNNSTHYLSIDTSSAPSNYITGKNKKIGVAYFSQSTIASASGYTTIIVESPLIVKYRW